MMSTSSQQDAAAQRAAGSGIAEAAKTAADPTGAVDPGTGAGAADPGAGAGAADPTGAAATATCGLCPHHCRLHEGQLGLCHARRAVGGSVVSDTYGELTSIALDPVEKKPLARYMPGSMVLSVGSYGCNLRCPFCQNASISLAGETARARAPQTRHVTPEELVGLAASPGLRQEGNIGIAYTYNEPLVGIEYVRDCSRLAHEAGLKNVLVSNGCACEGPLRELLPLIDAANIDLKGFDQDFYDLVGGNLETVKKTIRLLHESGCHVEVTTLVIPGLNDSEATIDALSSWLASVDRAIPYHVSRFFPRHRMTDRPPTPVETVRRLADVARKNLDYVYTGNC